MSDSPKFLLFLVISKSIVTETKKNTLGTVVINVPAQEYLLKLASFLEAKAYSPMTIRNYMAEMRYIFAYYNHLNPEQLTQDHIASYISYIKKEHGVGRDKCRMTAQSCSFFFKHILPSPYVVPHELNPVIMGNRSKLFDALFAAASQSLLRHSRMPEYLGAEPGITMVLHTWGQDLSFHPHVHSIVSSGGSDGQQWIEAQRKNNRFLFPQAGMAKMFKAKGLSRPGITGASGCRGKGEGPNRSGLLSILDPQDRRWPFPPNYGCWKNTELTSSDADAVKMAPW